MSWSKKHDCCVTCGTTERKHKSRGRCNRCTMQDRYHANPGEWRRKAKLYYLSHADKLEKNRKAWREIHPECKRAWQVKYREKIKRIRGVGHSARWYAGVEVVDGLLGRGICAGRAKREGGDYIVPVRFPASGNVIELITTTLRRTGYVEASA